MNQLLRIRAARGAAIALLLVGTPTLVTAGDAFFRGGVVFEPRDIGFEGRWRVAFGSDYAVNFRQTVFVGFEIQTSAFRLDVAGSDRTATLFPGNGFINVKYKADKFEIRPYAGLGFGMVTFFTIADETTWDRHLGMHFQFGVELARLAVELQMQRAFVDEAVFEYSILFGFLF